MTAERPAPGDTTSPRPNDRVIGYLVKSAAGLVLLCPFVVTAVLWRDGWMPVSDQAAVVIRAFDTFSRHPPLYGNASALTEASGSAVQMYHPGPVQLWLLAGPVHWFAPSANGALVGSAVLIAACMAVALLVAHRRGSWPTTALMVVLLVVLAIGVEPSNLSTPFQPWLCSFALVAFVVCGWAAVEGDAWLWPAVVFFGSLAAGPEVAFLIPVGVTSVALVACRMVWWRQDRRRPATVRLGRRKLLFIGTLSASVALVCWSGPIYDQFSGSGNLWRMISAGTGAEHAGPVFALQALVTVVAGPAWVWDRSDFYGFAFGSPDMAAVWQPAVWQVVLAVVVAVILVIGMWRAVARSDRRRIVIGVLGLALVLGTSIATALFPGDVDGVGHFYVWMAPTCIVWWFVALTVSDLAQAVIRRSGRVSPNALRIVLVGVAPVVAALVLMILCVFQGYSQRAYAVEYFATVRAFGSAGAQVCRDRHGPVLVGQQDRSQTSLTQGVIAELQLHGCTVHVDGLQHTVPGVQHRPTGREPVLLVVSASAVAPNGFRLLSSHRNRTGSTRFLYLAYR